MALVRHTKSTLHVIRSLTGLARTKFSDKEFGEFFDRSVQQDIGEADLLLEGFLQYLSINTPLKKKDTVHRLIDEVLKKYQVQLEEKGVRLSKRYEKDLPEPIIPDEPLRYILNSIFQYGVNVVTLNGDIEFLTRSLILQEVTGAEQGMLSMDERTIEIKMGFTGDGKPGEPFEESRVFREEEPLNLLLRLVKEVVRKNRGTMRFETDGEKGNILISIRFPSERREIVLYQPIQQFMN